MLALVTCYNSAYKSRFLGDCASRIWYKGQLRNSSKMEISPQSQVEIKEGFGDNINCRALEWAFYTCMMCNACLKCTTTHGIFSFRKFYGIAEYYLTEKQNWILDELATHTATGLRAINHLHLLVFDVLPFL